MSQTSEQLLVNNQKGVWSCEPIDRLSVSFKKDKFIFPWSEPDGELEIFEKRQLPLSFNDGEPAYLLCHYFPKKDGCLDCLYANQTGTRLLYVEVKLAKNSTSYSHFGGEGGG